MRGQGLDEGGQSHDRFSPLGKTPGVKLVHSFVLPDKRMQFNMISQVLTELQVFSTNISKQTPITMTLKLLNDITVRG